MAESDDSTDLPHREKIMHSIPKVIIIGAGIAGIAAANQLAINGVTDFKIIEATYRTGGRIKSVPVDDTDSTGENGRVELGANWIHGIDRNPIYKIADDHDLLKLQSRRNLREKILSITEGGVVVPPKIVREVDWEYGRLMQNTEQFFQCGIPTPVENDSVGHFLDREMAKYLDKYTGKERFYRELVYKNRKSLETCISGCHTLNDVSLQEIGSYEELPGIHYTIPPGFEAVLDILKEDIPPDNFVLSCPVRCIDYSNENDVCVECVNGDKYYADHVIVSVSLGVLKSHASTLFHPVLPRHKLSAIDHLAFGVVNKIILEFDRDIVDPDVRMIQCLWDIDETQKIEKNWYKKIYSFDVVHENVLMGWLSGKEAEYMEKLPDEEIGRACVESLQKFLQQSNIPMPKKIIKTCWSTDPYQRGSYTFIPVGGTVDDIENLSEPIKTQSGKPAVCFAGEATHASFYSSTHGALLTGRREADRIVAHYCPQESQSDEEYSASPALGNGFTF